jgi:hypothetical protein
MPNLESSSLSNLPLFFICSTVFKSCIFCFSAYRLTANLVSSIFFFSSTSYSPLILSNSIFYIIFLWWHAFALAILYTFSSLSSLLIISISFLTNCSNSFYCSAFYWISSFSCLLFRRLFTLSYWFLYIISLTLTWYICLSLFCYFFFSDFTACYYNRTA